MTEPVPSSATREDAMLIVQLLRWGNEMGLEDAYRTIFAEDFDPATEPMDSPAVGKVLTFGETIATLVKHGTLDRGLLVDLLWVEGIWAKVESHARQAREREHEPRLYENFEALVK
jgi:hypothetical protein